MLPKHYKQKTYNKVVLDQIYKKLKERYESNKIKVGTILSFANLSPKDMCENAILLACKQARADEIQSTMMFILEIINDHQPTKQRKIQEPKHKGSVPRKKISKTIKKHLEKDYPTWRDFPDAQELPGGINNPNNWDPYMGYKP